MKASDRHEPFFVVGCPRSGTTLLQLLIDAHPRVAIPPESHVFVRFSRIFECYGDLQESSNLRLLVKDILEDDRIQDWGLQVTVTEFCDQLDSPSIECVIALLFELFAQREGKSRWGDKTPQHALYLKEIKTLFPGAKIIHIIRDGRDVAVSFTKGLVGPGTIYGSARLWRKYILAVEQAKQTIDASDYIEIRYEAMVRNPKRELTRVLRFIDEDYLSNEASVPDTSRKQWYVQTDSHMRSLSEPISTSKIGVFEKSFTRKQIEIFETIAKDALMLSGYDVVTAGRKRTIRWAGILFFVHDKFTQYRRKYLRLSARKRVWKLASRELQDWSRKLKRLARYKLARFVQR